jgi:sugar lactone lactonase YvrE
MPDGRLFIDTMFDGRLLRLEPDGSLVTYADLTSLAHDPWSDLIVDGRGNAYVGNLGFNFTVGEAFVPGILVLVTPDGSARQVADGLAFPNGIAVTPDNSTLIVAESYGARLTAFDISTDGSLSNRRVWAGASMVLTPTASASTLKGLCGTAMSQPNVARAFEKVAMCCRKLTSTVAASLARSGA